METTLKQTVHLTATDFKEKVFNYETGKEWKYEGTLPAIIDFYADWCAPCKMVAPVLEELSSEYEGKLYVYKIDTEAEQELASVFGIRSIPTLLIFKGGQVVDQIVGAVPKGTIVDKLNMHLN